MDAGPELERDGSPESDAGPVEGTPRVLVDSAPARGLLVPTARFAFSCAEAPCTFACRVDDDDFAPCESPYETRPTLPGNHTFEVRAERGDAVGPAERRAFTNRLPYTVVDADEPLLLDLNGFPHVTADFRCTRSDTSWSGESMLDDERPDPFECPIERWLEYEGAGANPEFASGRGIELLGVHGEGEATLHVRVRKPAGDPAPWPEGSVFEVARRVVRDAPVAPTDDAGVDDGGVPSFETESAFVLGTPMIGSTCPADTDVTLNSQNIGATLSLQMFALAPPDPSQTNTSCSIRIPVTIQHGASRALIELGSSGFAEGGAGARVQVELAGASLFDSRIDLGATDFLAIPVQQLNWEACPVTRELVIRADLEGLMPMGDTPVSVNLDFLFLGLYRQASFGWQTCAP